MAFNYKRLGEKLRLARTNLQISVEEAAAKIGRTPSDYTAIEEGRIPANGDDIVLLSKLYLEDFRYFVSQDYKSVDKQIQALFRQNDQLSKSDRWAIREFALLCEYKSFYEELLQKPVAQSQMYSNKDFTTNNCKRQGMLAAQLERKRLKIKGPIPNVYSIIRKQGIHTFRRVLEDGSISGVYINYPNVGHCILINYFEDLYRQNFSAAHEYAHVLFDSESSQIISYQGVKPTRNQNDKSTNSMEWRANSFASHFLVPDEELVKLNKPITYEDYVGFIQRACHYFQVNSQVIIIRLKENKWINEELEGQLNSEARLKIKKNTKNDPEISRLSIGLQDKVHSLIKGGISVEYVELARTAYEQGLVTYGKMLESLMLPYEKAKELMDIYSVFLEV